MFGPPSKRWNWRQKKLNFTSMSLINFFNLTKKDTAKKRVGRGTGSGKGKTAGRGTKGQKSRSGYNIPRRFEGGQNSLISRLPKSKGYKNRPRKNKPIAIRIDKLAKIFFPGEIITKKNLALKKIISFRRQRVKIIGGTAKNNQPDGLIIKGIRTSRSLNLTK